MKQITKDMIIRDILMLDIETARYMMKAGMHCVGCPSASGESLEDACLVHGADVDLLVKEINEYLASKGE